MPPETELFDVAIVGGGPAGALLARELRIHGCTVLVVEASETAASKPGEVLAPPAMRALSALGLLDTFVTDTRLAVPCDGLRQRWGSSRELLQDFLREPGSRGFVVDRQRFEEQLATRAVRVGVDWWWGTRLIGLQREPASWQLHFEQHRTGALRTPRARFVVDASGRARVVARRLGIRSVVESALVAASFTWNELATSSRWVEIEAIREGWWYFTCGPGTHRVGAFVTTPKCWKTLSRQSDFAHGLWLQPLLERADAANLPPQPRLVNASASRLEQCTGEGWLAVGDAATSFDPLTSQGLPNAFGMALAAAAALVQLLEYPASPARETYEQSVLATWRHAQAGLRPIYASERRWADAPFWRSMVRGSSAERDRLR